MKLARTFERVGDYPMARRVYVLTFGPRWLRVMVRVTGWVSQVFCALYTLSHVLPRG